MTNSTLSLQRLLLLLALSGGLILGGCGQGPRDGDGDDDDSNDDDDSAPPGDQTQSVRLPSYNLANVTDYIPAIGSGQVENNALFRLGFVGPPEPAVITGVGLTAFMNEAAANTGCDQEAVAYLLIETGPVDLPSLADWYPQNLVRLSTLDFEIDESLNEYSVLKDMVVDLDTEISIGPSETITLTLFRWINGDVAPCLAFLAPEPTEWGSGSEEYVLWTAAEGDELWVEGSDIPFRTIAMSVVVEW